MRSGRGGSVVLLVGLGMLTLGCTDAATRFRVAAEDQARRSLAGAPESSVFRYAPGLWPEGCGGRYEVAVSPAVGVGICCWRRP